MEFIDSKHLFNIIGKMFQHPELVVEELIENSIRAEATRVDIELSKKVLKAVDNGKGCIDWQSLIVIAKSAFSEKQNPAGMGLYQLYSISHRVTIKSNDWILEVDTNRLFIDESYRKELNIKKSKESLNGFSIEADLKDELKIDRARLEFYPIDTFINSEKVDKRRLPAFSKSIKKYKGLKVYFNPNARHWESTKLIWFGKLIELRDITSCSIGIHSPFILEVNDKTNIPLTPRLPDRVALSNSTSEIVKFLKEIEGYFKKEIYKVLNGGHLEILDVLRLEYEEFYSWGIVDGLTNSDYQNIFLKSEDIKLYGDLRYEVIVEDKIVSEDEFSKGDYWFRDVKFAPNFIKRCKQPKWVKNKVSDVTVKIYTSNKEFNAVTEVFSDLKIMQVEKIEVIRGDEIKEVEFFHSGNKDDGMVFITTTATYDEHYAEWDEWMGNCIDEDTGESFYNLWDKALNELDMKLNDRVNVSNFLSQISDRVKLSFNRDIKVKSVEFGDRLVVKSEKEGFELNYSLY